MTKYISKEVARRIIDSERSKEQMLRMLEQTPTADVRKNKKGNWRISYVPSIDEIKIEYCFECGWGKMIEEKREYNFCPNCGADMRTKEGEEDG